MRLNGRPSVVTCWFGHYSPPHEASRGGEYVTVIIAAATLRHIVLLNFCCPILYFSGHVPSQNISENDRSCSRAPCSQSDGGSNIHTIRRYVRASHSLRGERPGSGISHHSSARLSRRCSRLGPGHASDRESGLSHACSLSERIRSHTLPRSGEPAHGGTSGNRPGRHRFRRC